MLNYRTMHFFGVLKLKKHDDLHDKNDKVQNRTFNPLAAVSKRTYIVLLFLWILIIIVDGIKQYFVNY